jgi:hypothetical protein
MSALRWFLFAASLAGLEVMAHTPARAAELLVGNKSADTVWRLSLRDGRRIGEFRTGEAPHEIAVAPDGRMAVVTNYGNARSRSSLSVLDLVDGRPTRTIDLGQHGAPHGLRFLPDWPPRAGDHGSVGQPAGRGGGNGRDRTRD